MTHFRKLAAQPPIGATAAGAGVIFLALVFWARSRGFAPGDEALRIEHIARSFESFPYASWVKTDFTYPSEILHHDFRAQPLPVAVSWVAGKLGLGGWAKTGYLTAGVVAALLPASHWALGGAAAALSAWALCALAAATGFLALVPSGALGTAGAALFLVLAYGCQRRNRAIEAGALLGLATLCRFDAAFLVPGFIISDWVSGCLSPARKARQTGILIGAFLGVTSVWWIRSLLLGASPWFHPLQLDLLGGEAGVARWYPDADSGMFHPNPRLDFYVEFERSERAVWFGWTGGFLGDYFREFVLLGALLFALFLHGLRRPGARFLAAWTSFSIAAVLLSRAGLADLSLRSELVPLDWIAACWFATLATDGSPKLRITALAIGVCVACANLGDLRALGSPAQTPMRDRAPRMARAVAELNTDRAAVVITRGQGLALGYFLPGVPVVETPSNWSEPGVLDAFLDRFRVRWALIDGDQAQGVLKTHRLERRVADGVVAFEVQRAQN